MTVQKNNPRIGVKISKRSENCLRKAREVCNQTDKVFLSGKKDLKQRKKLKEIKRKTPNRQGYPQWSHQFCCKGKYHVARV